MLQREYCIVADHKTEKKVRGYIHHCHNYNYSNLKNKRYVVNLRANCWELKQNQNQQNKQCLQIFILVLPGHFPKRYHYLVTNNSLFSFFLFGGMALFSTNLCIYMWTQKTENVHHTQFLIYYSPLWLTIFKHHLKNLCLLFLESE